MIFFLAIIILFFPASLCTQDLTTEKQNPTNITYSNFEQSNYSATRLAGYWVTKPKVVICDNVVTRSRAQQAVNYWLRAGYRLGPIEMLEGYECFSVKNKTNTIFIQLPLSTTDMANKLALTNTTRSLDTNINLWSDIFIHSFAGKLSLVLEHEIGHALGWRHSNRKYHIMYPDFKMIGSSSLGVRYRDYRGKVAEKYDYFLPLP